MSISLQVELGSIKVPILGLDDSVSSSVEMYTLPKNLKKELTRADSLTPKNSILRFSTMFEDHGLNAKVAAIKQESIENEFNRIMAIQQMGKIANQAG